MKKRKRNGILKAIGITVILAALISASVCVRIYNGEPINIFKIEPEPTEEISWVKIGELNSWEVGEYDPGTEGWLATFMLDYGEVPETVLANNATDWSVAATARGYVDVDNQETDLKSEDAGFPVVRCKFDDDSKEGASWNWSRLRVNLTLGGSETINDVGEYDNSSSAGDAVISASTDTRIYINFWWDDGVDGYTMPDDGTITWSITIWERK